MRALKVMSSYTSENSIAPSYVRKLTMAEFEFKERIAKPHVYAPSPSDMRLLAKRRRNPLLYDGSHDCAHGESETAKF